MIFTRVWPDLREKSSERDDDRRETDREIFSNQKYEKFSRFSRSRRDFENETGSHSGLAALKTLNFSTPATR